MGHTPTPWVFKEDRHDLIAIGSQDHPFTCCVVHGASPSTFADEVGIKQAAQQRANAAFIVRACNAHDELVSALKSLGLKEGEYGYGVVQAALAKAEGK